jgi:hypothetical protein
VLSRLFCPNGQRDLREKRLTNRRLGSVIWEEMHAHESSSDHAAERPRKAPVFRPDSGGPAVALTRDSLLHLQRTAGNGAVASALAVQRKKNVQLDDGQIVGMFSWLDDKSAPRQSAIAITDGYLKI